MGCDNTIQYKTYNAPYVTEMFFVGADVAYCPSCLYSANANCEVVCVCIVQMISGAVVSLPAQSLWKQ